METLVINIPDKKSGLVKQLLKELGVTINPAAEIQSVKRKNIPNALTVKTIEDAHKGIGLEEPVKNIKEFMKSL